MPSPPRPESIAAFSPPLLALALLLPGRFDPLAPLWSAPSLVWVALLLSGICVVVAIGYAIQMNVRPWLAAIALLAGLAATASCSMALSEALLVRRGAGMVLPLLLAVLVPAVAGWAVFSTKRVAAMVILAGSAFAVPFAGRAFDRAPIATPSDLLRKAMVEAPGWGSSSLGALLRRNALRPWLAGSYESRLRSLSDEIARLEASHGFAAEWEDDAHLVRGWLLLKIAASPTLAPPMAAALRRDSGQESLAFAAAPTAHLQRFTRQGILYLDAMSDTADLAADEDLRFRVGTAWKVVEMTFAPDGDPALQHDAVLLLRQLFDQNHLNRMDALYLEAISTQALALATTGDAQGYLALFDAEAAGTWPPPMKREWAARAAEVRNHPDHDYAPVMLFVRAKALGKRDQDPRPLFKELLEKWPDATIAPEAKLALDQAGKPAEAP